MAKTTKVTIGNTTINFILAATTAPEPYDAFDTFTIREIENPGEKLVRIVLIPEERLSWQVGRYGSGLYGWTTEAERFDYFDPEFIDVEKLLWERISR